MEGKYSNIFHEDMYPTPSKVLDLMQIDCVGHTVLEPSAGKGNIITYLKLHGAANISFCEINEDLATICKPKATFIKNDFLKVTGEEISHITQIVMNPPFSESKKHILHAWNVAPDGCEIISLCNSDSISHWGRQSEIGTLISSYGNSVSLGECFSTAERKTNVSVSCIKLYKPVTNQSTNFEGFYMDAEPETAGSNGIMKYNEVQSLVNSYMGAIKCYDEFSVINARMTSLCSPVGMGNGFSYSVAYDKTVVTKSDFSKHLQKKSWKYIFDKMNLNKYLTSGVMKDINNFVEHQSNIPFTVKNIYKMFDIIVGTKDQTFNKALVEAIDKFTQYTHENRYGVEGWKTNSGYMLNKKFIVDYIAEPSYVRGLRVKGYGSNFEKIEDLIKVICNITGTNHDKMMSIEYANCDKNEEGYLTEKGHRVSSDRNTGYGDKILRYNQFEPNTWYDWEFFEFKLFKKSTMHLKFKDEKIWEKLNRAYAKIKGEVLPEKI